MCAGERGRWRKARPWNCFKLRDHASAASAVSLQLARAKASKHLRKSQLRAYDWPEKRSKLEGLINSEAKGRG